MTNFQDHFSEQASQYARYRPGYPGELFTYLASIAPAHELAWDCGTGNGQAALELVKRFSRVVATDPSAEQLAQAPVHPRIEYRNEPAEQVSFEVHSVDLITVAVAAHWFDLDRFYQTVRRVAVPDGVLAVWTYSLPVIDPAIDAILTYYYQSVLGGYWPEQIRYLDEHYASLPFPFAALQPPEFTAQAEWDLAHLAGFLDSWSATRKYQQVRGGHPLQAVWADLTEAWGDARKPRSIHWPLYLRVGRV